MTYPKKPERKPGETDSDFSARIEAWAVRLAAAKEKARKYRVENAERIHEQRRKYRTEHLEQCREQRRKRYAEHAEREREYTRKYRTEHLAQLRERDREYMRKYRAENAERLNEQRRKCYAEHAERERERKRKRYAEHLEQRREYARKRYAEHLEQCREYARKRYAEHAGRERERERYAKKLGLSRAEYLKTVRHARGVKASFGEAVVCYYLESAGIKFEREKTFDWLRNSETGRLFRCDFYLPDLDTVIEYNGPQHYGYRIHGCFKSEDLARRMVMDVEKAEKITARGLRLIAIPGDEIRKAGQIRRYLARELASDERVDSK